MTRDETAEAEERVEEPSVDAPVEPAEGDAPAEPAPPPRWRRRLSRWRALSWRRRLLSENLRLGVAWLLALAIGLPTVFLFSAPIPDTRADGVQMPLTLMVVIVILSIYALVFAGLTLWVLSGASRSRMVAAARLPRARRHVRFYRWYLGRTSAFGEVVQMLLIAVTAVFLLISPPPWIPVAALLALTVASVITAWISAVATFAVEYAAEDSRGSAFSLPGSEAPTGADRDIQDYVYGALLIQTTSGTGEMVPLTSSARRLVRRHVLLAYLMSTIIITLGVSAVITAVA